jgi:hypothetical protein
VAYDVDVYFRHLPGGQKNICTGIRYNLHGILLKK